MKKIISVMLALVMICSTLLAFASCTGSTKVKTIDIALTTEKYAFGVKKGNTELLQSLNDFLAQIQSNGTFEAIVNKYFGDGTPEGVASATKDESKDQLVVATNAAFKPFEYKEGNLYYGVDMEIMAAFAASLNLEFVVDDMNFDAVCTSVGSGLCDVAAAGLTIKPDREEILDFSTSYYDASQTLICLESDTTFDACTDVASMEAALKALPEGTKIGVQSGTTGYYYVKGDADWGFEGFANVEPKAYDNGAMAVQDLINGNIDYVIIDDAPAKNIVISFNN